MSSPLTDIKNFFNSKLEENLFQNGITKSAVLKTALAALVLVAIAVDIAKIGFLKATLSLALANPLVTFGVIFGICAIGSIAFIIVRDRSWDRSFEADVVRAQKRLDAVTKIHENRPTGTKLNLSEENTQYIAKVDLWVKKLVCYHAKSPISSITLGQYAAVASAERELSQARDDYQKKLKEVNDELNAQISKPIISAFGKNKNMCDLFVPEMNFKNASENLDKAEMQLAKAIEVYEQRNEKPSGNRSILRQNLEAYQKTRPSLA